MSEANGNSLDSLVRLSDCWAKKREEEAATMCAKRVLTEEEVDRAMVIGKWFFGWTDTTGPCPIGCTDEHWHKKLCALFEWIATLEADNSNELHRHVFEFFRPNKEAAIKNRQAHDEVRRLAAEIDALIEKAIRTEDQITGEAN
jgi:hypothetical protein